MHDVRFGVQRMGKFEEVVQKEEGDVKEGIEKKEKSGGKILQLFRLNLVTFVYIYA